MRLQLLTASHCELAPVLVTPHELRAWAQHVRSPWAHRPDLASVTVPRLAPDVSRLVWEKRGQKEATEFRFAEGVLALELRQHIYLLEGLSSTAQEAWLAHEALHVADHEAALAQLERELGRDPVLKAIFVEHRWWQAGWLHHVRATVREGVASVFWRLAHAAALRRDTNAAFARVQRLLAQSKRG